jgi:hypothetical protein
VLLLFASSLAVHFISDGLAVLGEQGMSDLDSQDWPPHPDIEGCEEDLVLPSPGSLQIEYSLTWTVPQTSIRNLSVAFSPLLPPPNSRVSSGCCQY